MTKAFAPEFGRRSPTGNPSGLAFATSRGRDLMIGLLRTAARAVAAALFLIAALGAAQAAGALAVGTAAPMAMISVK
jgi:predicted small integral membrane protein